jgi:hypothetical protein
VSGKVALPSYREVVDRLVAVTSERDALLQLLREMGAKEGDASLVRQVAIYRADALQRAHRESLARAALTALKPHWPAAFDEVQAWLEGTNQPLMEARRTA